MSGDFILILQEVRYHPNSLLLKITSAFETPSVVSVSRKDLLKQYQKPPLFDPRYLMLFDDVKVFEDNIPYINFDSMAVVVLVSGKTQADEVRFLCQEKNLPCRVACNEFTRSQALLFVAEKSSVEVSESFCKTVLRYTGLNPLRIMTAISVCEQMGYKASVIEKYVDKWMYPDTRKLIECLLHVPRNTSALRSAYSYLHLNRFYPNYIKRILLDELDVVLVCYRDKIGGRLSSESLLSYLEEKKYTRSRVMFALDLFDRVSIASVIALREFIKNADYMEIALHL